MSKKILNYLIVALSLTLLFSCSQPDNKPKEILSPSFINIPLSAPTGRAIITTPDTLQTLLESEGFLFYGYAPAISGFEKRPVSSGESYDVKILDYTIPITYEATPDNKSLFSGASNDEGLYTATLYSPETNSYSYTQAVNCHMDASSIQDYRGWVDRFNIAKGDTITIKPNGSSQGKMRHYFINFYADGSTEFSIGDAEFFSNELISAIMIKSLLSCSTDEDKDIVEPDIANLEPTIAGIDAIVALGDELYEANVDKVGDDYGIIYLDKETLEVKLFGADMGSITKTKAEVQAEATRISGGEWTQFLLE